LVNVSGGSFYLRARTANREFVGTRVAGAPPGPISGTTAWTEYALELIVPSDASFLDFGIRRAGAGMVWADDFKFETSDPITPMNLGFSDPKKGQ
jgi:hypothetical protein